jgi:hypothetical protein
MIVLLNLLNLVTATGVMVADASYIQWQYKSLDENTTAEGAKSESVKAFVDIHDCCWSS